jgi:phosphate starvation-inducible protein PhoH
VKNFCQEGRKIAEIVEKDGRMAVNRLQTAGKEAIEKRFGQKSAAKSDPLLIKKYVNGRFYDTVNKKYLKKADLVKLVEKGTAIRVIYTKTGRNVTRSVLAGLNVEKQTGKKMRLSIDDVANRLKENQKRVREAFERQLDSVRKAIKLPA